jgi:hypothetical protein
MCDVVIPSPDFSGIQGAGDMSAKEKTAGVALT